MTKEETAMFWQGVILGLNTAAVIAERNGTRNEIIKGIRKQRDEIENRDRDEAAAAALVEYNSWIRHLSAELEVRSWGSVPSRAECLVPTPEHRSV